MARSRMAPAVEELEAAAAPVAKKAPKPKLTIRLSPEMDVRLSALAAKERQKKGRFARKILDQGMRKYAFDQVLRDSLGTDQLESGDSAQTG